MRNIIPLLDAKNALKLLRFYLCPSIKSRKITSFGKYVQVSRKNSFKFFTSSSWIYLFLPHPVIPKLNYVFQGFFFFNPPTYKGAWWLKWDSTWKPFSVAWLGFNANISFAFQGIEKLFIHLTNLCFAEFCKFLGDFWGYLGGDSFSQLISEI